MKHYIRGFNLIELLVAIAISASIISAIVFSYSNLFSGYLFNNTKIDAQQSLKLAMSMIRHDVQNAGVFGSFSLHNASAGNMYNSIGSSCGNEWCTLDTAGVGVMGISSAPAGSGISGLTSEILRVQYGVNKVNYLTAIESMACASNNCINRMQFNNNGSIDLSASSYILASANHLYSLNGIGTPTTDGGNVIFNNLVGANYFIQIESQSDGIIYDPDQYTMQLMNLNTKYYYVATVNSQTGLYVVTFNGVSLGSPVLISTAISSLSLKYIIYTTTSSNFSNSPVNDSYTICTTSEMNNSGNSRCFNRWGRVLSVIITLTSSVTNGANTTTQTISDNIGWLR